MSQKRVFFHFFVSKGGVVNDLNLLIRWIKFLIEENDRSPYSLYTFKAFSNKLVVRINTIVKCKLDNAYLSYLSLNENEVS